MPYNAGFPLNYVPFQPVQQPFQPAQQPFQAQAQAMTPPTIHADIVQVDGIQVAESYPVSVGVPQMMISKDESEIYIKTAYANGQYSIDIFKKQAKPVQTAAPNLDDYLTKDEFESRIKAILEAKTGKTEGSES